jgi:iron complex outermembrane receptor protein
MKNLFMIGIMLISFGMHAQKILSGKISDQNGNPLYGVTIGIPDLNKGTRSSDDGSYHISQLPAGKMYVYFSLPGYAEHNEMVELNTDSTVLNIVMEVTVIETEEVVISAGYRSTQHQNAVKIDKIDVLSIDLKSTPNFMEMITKVPGVDMISKGSGISKPVIRGLSMNDVLVLNNGVRHENYQYSDHHPLGIDEF